MIRTGGKMRTTLLVCLAAVFLLSACQAGVDDRRPDPPGELLEAMDSFYAAIESDDVEARIALLADDIVMMPNHWTIGLGRESVAAGLRAIEGAVFRIRDREVLRVSVSGDLAYTVNSYYYTYHASGDEPQWHKTKNVHVWRRDQAGLWKLEVDIWNSDVPVSAFSGE